jgi:hypothetical protein
VGKGVGLEEGWRGRIKGGRVRSGKGGRVRDGENGRVMGGKERRLKGGKGG